MLSTKLPSLDAKGKATTTHKRRRRNKGRKVKKKRAQGSKYFRSTIIAWGPSSGYAPNNPAVTLTKAEKKGLEKPVFIKESPRNRGRHRALTGIKPKKKKRKHLKPIKSSPSIDSLVIMDDPEEKIQQNARLEPIVDPRTSEISSSSDKTQQAEDGNSGEQSESRPPFAKDEESVENEEPVENVEPAENDEPTENGTEVDASQSDAQVFSNIADNLANVVEAVKNEPRNSIMIRGPLSEIADVTELKLMQDILAEKIIIRMDPNEPPPDARVGEVESGDVPALSMDSYQFHDKEDIDAGNCFEPEDEGATLLNVGQRCAVFKPAHGVDWWPASVLAVHPSEDDDSASATYTVEFLSGYYLGDVDTDVSRNNIDSTRPFRHWAGRWRREMGAHLFLGNGQVDTPYRDMASKWHSDWYEDIGKYLYGDSQLKVEEDVKSTENWHLRWQREIGNFLFTE